MNTEYKGYIFSILSSIIFGLMPLMAKYIYAQGGNSISLVFYRTFLALPVLYFLSRRSNKNGLKISMNELKKILILVIGYTSTPLLLYSSYNYISSGASTTIHFSYPVLILIGSVLVYKSRISKIEGFCVLLCTAGILLITDFREINNVMGVILAFASGITYAVYALYLDKSGLITMNVYTLCFYMAGFTSVIVLLYLLFKGQFIISLSIEGWILSFVFSILVTVFAVVFFQMGIKYIGAQKTSILSTFEPVTSVIIGIVILDESFSIIKGTAILFILISAIVLAKYGD